MRGRFLAKVEKTPGCWEWRGYRCASGYGRFFANGKAEKAHRISYQLFVGPIPEGFGWHGTVIRHTCDNRGCVNPEHLELGSQGDNIQDCFARGRARRATGQNSARYTKPERTARGVRNGRAKLTEETVSQARCLHKAGASVASLATVYGVGETTMSQALLGQTWRHVR